MALSFAVLDPRLTRTVRELHDYLWDPTWNGDDGALRGSVLKDAKSLDGFLRAGGRLLKNAKALAEPWDRERQGSALFELLNHVHGLTAATEHFRKRRYLDAALRAQGVVESTSIGVCSAARHFELVEEWEARKIDFETYANRLAEVLDSKLIPQAQHFRRILNAVHAFGSEWDGSATKSEQALAARAVIEDTAWCVSRSLTIRALLGEPPKVSEKDFGVLLDSIVHRL